MKDLPETRASLLLRLRDRTDQQAWEEFSQVYEPAVYRVARCRGLQHVDALDLTQEVLAAVAGAIDRWEHDPQRGRFRTWLYTVARNMTVNALTRGARDRGSGDTNMIELLRQHPETDAAESALFELEYRREAFARAAEQVRRDVTENTWQAFWLTTIDELSVEAAARRLNTTAGAVYAARSRVLAHLRRRVEELEGRGT